MNSRFPPPKLGSDVFVASTAYVGGDVEIGDGCTIMHHVVVRGDIASIRIGQRVNIQDGSILHTNADEPLDIGDDVAIGHRAVVHCRSVGSGSLIGIGAILSEGCEIGSGCIVAPGALVPPNAQVKPNSVVMGVPARFVRTITQDDFARIKHTVNTYIHLGAQHRAGEFPNIVRGPSIQ